MAKAKKPRPKNHLGRPWEPGELAILKLAEDLNSKGLFWPKQFNEISFWKDTDGNHTIVRRNKAGELRLVRVDKKYAGRFNRLLVEEIPPQVEAIFRDMESKGTIPEGTYEKFVSWQNTGVREAFGKSVETTHRTGVDTEGGHLLELEGSKRARLSGKRTPAAIDAPPHTGLTIIDESRNPYLNAEGILMPGNNPKGNHPGWHLDPKQMDAAGLPASWGQLMNRFLTGKSGANVETISEDLLKQVRDKEINLDQAVALQDQKNQKLAWEEGERYRQQQTKPAETKVQRVKKKVNPQILDVIDTKTGETVLPDLHQQVEDLKKGFLESNEGTNFNSHKKTNPLLDERNIDPLSRRRAIATGATLGSLTALGAVGAPFSVAGADERFKIYEQTKKPTDAIAAGLELISGFGDVGGPVGEVIATAADLTLLGMDAPQTYEALMHRSDPEVELAKQEQKEQDSVTSYTAQVGMDPQQRLVERSNIRQQQYKDKLTAHQKGREQEKQWQLQGQDYVTQTPNPLERLNNWLQELVQ